MRRPRVSDVVICSRCNADVPPGNQCASCGAFISGNEANLRHGLRRFETRRVLPPDLKVDVETFRDQLVSDQGGLDDLTAVRAGLCRLLTDAEAGRRLCMRVVVEKGIESKAGRAAYDRLLATMDRWMRLAAALGVERRARQVPTLAEYMQARASDRANSRVREREGAQ
jgi:hypothetical protein